MEGEKLLTYSGVCHKVKSCFLSKNSSHSFVRGVVLGTLVMVYLIQICSYVTIRKSIKIGEMPWYTADALIVGLSFMELLLAPFLAWLGYWRRKTTMAIWTALVGLLALAFLGIPTDDPITATEFCNSTLQPPAEMFSGKAIAKLLIVLLLGLTSCFTMVSMLSHGIAYMDEYQSDGISAHFGLLVAFRVVGVMFLSKMFGSKMSITMAVIMMMVQLLLQAVQLLKVPNNPTPAEGQLIPREGRSLFVSLGRVLSNSVAVSQMFGLAFIAAGLWGFAWHEIEVVKVLYLTFYTDNWMDGYSDVMRFHAIVPFVLLAGSKFCKPIMNSFSRVSALKVATVFSILAVPLYMVLVFVFSCPQGDVSGISGNTYVPPTCSQTCGCGPPMDVFNPVCAVNTMTTYLSPCHAGCTRSESFNGIAALANCSCAGLAGRVTYGACSMQECRTSFELHKLIYFVLIIFCLMAFQMQGVVVIRSVDPRDRSVALGAACSIVALMTFVVGHSVFIAIRATTCAWFQGGSCQLHSPLFPPILGATCSGFTLIAVAINLVTFCRSKNQKEDTAMQSDLEL